MLCLMWSVALFGLAVLHGPALLVPAFAALALHVLLGDDDRI